jgi:hypothetical protein
MLTLVRNIGSSIGISMVIANLTSTTTLMHARLAEHINPFNNALQQAGSMLSTRTDQGRACSTHADAAGDGDRLRQHVQAADGADAGGAAAGAADRLVAHRRRHSGARPKARTRNPETSSNSLLDSGSLALRANPE